jgi:hypothetical protein
MGCDSTHCGRSVPKFRGTSFYNQAKYDHNGYCKEFVLKQVDISNHRPWKHAIEIPIIIIIIIIIIMSPYYRINK